MTAALDRKIKVPKHKKITQHMRLQVEEGALRPGDRLPSFAEMREQYGISQATIERIYVSLEQDGLVVREQGRGTFVAPPALRKVTGILGVMGGQRGEWQNSLYWAHLLDGVRDVANSHGLQTLLIDAENNFDAWEKVDGVLVAGMEKESLSGLLATKLPSVSLLKSVAGVPSVVADDYGGAREATEYLLAQGHKRIGFLGAAFGVLSNIRLSAYSTALEGAGIRPDPRWMRRLDYHFAEKDPFVAQGRDRMREWLTDEWDVTGCTAILAHNDHLAVGAIQTLEAAGIRVPHDVSVVGFDGTEIYEYFKPKLTTVEVPLKAIGAAGARLLLRQIAGEAVETSTISLTTPLRVRDSTAAAPGGL